MGTGRNVRTRQHEGVRYEDRHARGIGFLSMSKKRQTNEERSYQTRSTYPFFSSRGGAGTDPHLLLMRCGDIETNPGPVTPRVQAEMNNVKSLQITWEDGRVSWVKPYRVQISNAGLGDKVQVKWGKSKKLYPGTITGIMNPQSCSQNSTGCADSCAAPRPNYANDVMECINTPTKHVGSTPAPTSEHVPGAETLNESEIDDPNLVVEDNTCPPPRPRCITCNGVFRPQYRPITCSDESCVVLVHRQQQCSGLNREEQRAGKTWRCQEHGGDCPQPQSINPTPQSADGPCFICKKRFSANISPLICRLCSGGAHASCSGIDRWNVTKLRRNGKWECQVCIGEIDPSVNSQSEDLPKGRCDKCPRAICKGVRRAKCCTCSQLFHRSCTGLTKDSMDPVLNSNNWSCQKCCSKGSHPSTLPIPETPNEKHEPNHCGPTGSLRILQWNADGLNPKIAELRDFVGSHKIDVAMIQETKLTTNKATPDLNGYTAIRADRAEAEFPGGGLIIYVKHNIAFRKIGQAKNGLVEAQSVSIQQRRGKWLDLTNIYAPPGRDDFNITWIPVSDVCVIAGDFNGHSKLWDRNQPNDKRGDDIVDFTLTHNLFLCNDGSPTRINRGTGGMSSPDITIASTSLANKISWATLNDLGSDHMPIVIEVKNEHTKRHPQSKKQRRRRWRSAKADWTSFANQIDKKLAEDVTTDAPKKFSTKVANFNKILVQAGYNHVGKTSPKNRDSWMNSDIRAKVKNRNLLRREVGQKRKEWLDACVEVQQLMDEAKQKAWEDYLSEAEFNVDPSEMWRVIKNLSGTPDSIAPNEVLIVNGKAISSNPKKADAFASHYAKVSRLDFSKSERHRNTSLRKRMTKLQDGKEECCKKFSMQEMEAALKKTKTKGAPGSDDIPPSFLKNLGPKAKESLLDILNESFSSGEVPRIWRHAVIIPIIKAGKPSSKLASYRPISLTSCVVKLLERMLCDRLYYLAETNGWICRTQAGFRRSQSTEDQVIRISQGISDGFQKKPAQRTVLAMLDYSKAYDRVWQQELFHTLLDTGVPAQIIRWFRAFLKERTAQVLYNGVYSKRVFMRQGLPQGAVSSPLLFLFYINSISEVVPEGVELALFADDASLWASDSDLNKANRQVQLALDKVQEWSNRKKMMLNVDKSEATFFTPATNEAKWRPSLNLDKTHIPFNASPKFLGVHMDRTLSFQQHVTEVTKKVSERCKILASLAGKQWGWRKENLRRVYIATQRSVLDYAAAAWQPWLSATQLNKLEVAQNKALRLVTGQYSSTPTEALRIEAEVESYKTHSERIITIAAEKADRLPPDHPRHAALRPETHTTHRSKVRSSWREKTNSTRGQLPTHGNPVEALPSPFQKPWENSEEQRRRNWKVFTALPETPMLAPKPHPAVPNNQHPFSTRPRDTFWDTSDTADESSAKRLTAQSAIRMIDKYNISTTIYTDGSCKGGTKDGGAAAVITTGSAANPVILETIKKKGNKLTCSYGEEKAALTEALKWMTENQKYDDTIICSDSQALLTSIDSLNPDTQDIRKTLESLHGTTYLHWIPGHSNIPGNEYADQAAKEAAQLPDLGQGQSTISYGVARAVAKAHIKDSDSQHHLVSQTYKGYNRKRADSKIESRKDGALLAQLRAGHCLHLSHYKNRIDSTKSATCPRCGEEEETVPHWIRCPATIRTREEIFGKSDLNLDILTTNPIEILAFAKKTLLEGPLDA